MAKTPLQPHQRVHRLPVRVLPGLPTGQAGGRVEGDSPSASSPPARRATAQPPARQSPQWLNRAARARVARWTIVFLVGLTLVVWLATVGARLTTPNRSADSLIERIQAGILSAFSRPPQPTPTNSVDELRERIFPDLP